MNTRNRPFVVLLVLLIFGAGIAAGILGWIWISGGDSQPSRPVDEVLAELEATNDAANSGLAAEISTIIPAAVGTAVAEAVSASIPQAVDSALAEAAARAVSGAESSPVEFRIVPEQSRVTFTLEEDLRGARTTVIGSTSEVAGSIMVNSGSPAASSVGAIVINARTLETDNSFRNRALRSAILQSAQDDYEFIVFTPQSLSNFSAEIIDIGETITFDITGDLRIVEVTRTVTFSATVTLDSPTRISGSAAANVLYADFNLVIPQVPGVANVTDDVKLDIHFVAVSD